MRITRQFPAARACFCMAGFVSQTLEELKSTAAELRAPAPSQPRGAGDAARSIRCRVRQSCNRGWAGASRGEIVRGAGFLGGTSAQDLIPRLERAGADAPLSSFSQGALSGTASVVGERIRRRPSGGLADPDENPSSLPQPSAQASVCRAGADTTGRSAPRQPPAERRAPSERPGPSAGCRQHWLIRPKARNTSGPGAAGLPVAQHRRPGSCECAEAEGFTPPTARQNSGGR